MKSVIVFTDDAAALQCQVDIDALADWNGLSIGFEPQFWKGTDWQGEDWKDWPGSSDSKLIRPILGDDYRNGGTASFKSWGAWESFLHGYDTRAI